MELRACRRSDDETSLVSAEEGRAEREFEEEKFFRIFEFFLMLFSVACV